MVTQIRPANNKPWEEVVPGSNNSSEFQSVLYMVGAGARMGWENIPTKGLSLTEQVAIAYLRNLCETIEKQHTITGENATVYHDLLTTPGLLDAKFDMLNEKQKMILMSLGRMWIAMAQVNNANPVVKRFSNATEPAD